MSGSLSCHPAPQPAPPWRRRAGVAGWIIPTATLILLPKCPLCIAMDVALFAGAGISAAGATTLWTATWLLCAAALLGQVLRMLLRRRSGRCAIRQQAGWLQRENPARREGGRG